MQAALSALQQRQSLIHGDGPGEPGRGLLNKGEEQGAALLPPSRGVQGLDGLGRCCSDKPTAEPSSLPCPSTSYTTHFRCWRDPKVPPDSTLEHLSIPGRYRARSIPLCHLTGAGIVGLHGSGDPKTKHYPVSWKPATPSALDMVAHNGTGRSRKGCSQPPLL